MIRKLIAVLLVAVAAVLSLSAEEMEVFLNEIKDERVGLFIDEYAGGFDVDEYVELVDTVSDIFFSYDKDNDYYSVYIEYPGGNMACIEFLYNELYMYYVDITEIPESSRSRALELVNEVNSDDYLLALGTVFLDGNYLGCRHIVVDDGVSDAGQWAFWNFYMFESYAQNSTSGIIRSLD